MTIFLQVSGTELLHVPQFIYFYGEVTFVMGVSLGMVWNDLGYFNAHVFESFYFSWIVGHQS